MWWSSRLSGMFVAVDSSLSDSARPANASTIGRRRGWANTAAAFAVRIVIGSAKMRSFRSPSLFKITPIP